MDGWFNGFGNAASRKGGNFYNPGVYDIEVISLSRQLSSKPETKGHQLAIHEGRILDTLTAYPAEVDASGKVRFAASNSPGERCSSIWNVTKDGDTALGNIKSFLLGCLQTADVRVVRAALGNSAAEVTPEIADQLRRANDSVLDTNGWQAFLMRVTEPGDDTLVGLRLRLSAGKTTTKRGNPFTPLRWEPIPGAPARAAA